MKKKEKRQIWRHFFSRRKKKGRPLTSDEKYAMISLLSALGSPPVRSYTSSGEENLSLGLIAEGFVFYERVDGSEILLNDWFDLSDNTHVAINILFALCPFIA